MSVRDVIVRLFGDDKDLTAKLDNADRRISEFARSNPTAKLSVNDDNAKLILDDLKAKLTDYGRMSETARLRVDDVQALAAIDRLDLKMMMAGKKLDSLGKNMDLSGLARARSEVDAIGRSISGIGRGNGLLGKLFGGGGGGGGGIGGIAGNLAGDAGGSVGKDALSSVGGASNYLTGGAIAALIGLAMTIAPSVIPFALGGGVGLGGALGALTLGRTGGQKILADQQALAAARASIAGSKSGGSPSQLLALHQAQKQLAHDQGLYGGLLPFNSAVTRLGHSALGSFLSALNYGGTVRGPHGGERPGTSFLSGITGIVNQIGPFLKSIGPELGQMLKASLPFVQSFVKIMEQFAKTVMPAVTQSMKEFQPYLPQMVQAFLALSQGIAGFIKALGPGMQASVTLFKGLMVGVKYALIAIGYVATALAVQFANVFHTIRLDAHALAHAFDVVRHDIAAAFDWVVKRVRQDVDHVTNSLDHWRHDIAHVFDDIRHDISSIWDEIWNNTVGRVIRGVHDVEHWFHTMPPALKGTLAALPGDMLRIGENIMFGLLHGLEHIGATVLGWISNFVSSIPGKFMSLLGIHSPSKVMHDIGLNIGQGLALGIENSGGAVQLAASRLALGIPTVFNSRNIHHGRVNAGGAMAGATQIIISAEGDELLRAIVRALRYEIKTNGGGNVQQHLGWGSV